MCESGSQVMLTASSIRLFVNKCACSGLSLDYSRDFHFRHEGSIGHGPLLSLAWIVVSGLSSQPRTVLTATYLLGLSATYSLVVEIWSAPVLYIDSRGLPFVLGLVAGILCFYAFYGWLIYRTSQGVNVARYLLIALILVGISIHTLLAVSPAGELFGPLLITAILDGIRLVAAVLLIASPAAFWRQRPAG